MKLKYENLRSKIVCTIGPSSWDPEIMKEMIENGMDVARINGAFADKAEMLRVEELVRQFSDDVAMMIDIKGPEVRLNKFDKPLELKEGMEIEIGNSDKFDIYPANYPNTYEKMEAGQRVVVGDGDVALEVKERTENSFIVKVLYGEELKPGKALNFPGLRLNDNPITDKDRELLDYAMERNWEFVSASFIRTRSDAERIKKYIGDNLIENIAKIEDAEGVDNIDEILEVVDGVMVARGGLGVDMGLAQVPIAQRIITEAAIRAGKPVITATQMLDSMERNIVPTRAEANDVATAIILGTDALMLSGESTAGLYPREAVEFLSEIDLEISGLIPPELVRDTAKQVNRRDALFSEFIFRTMDVFGELKAVVYVTGHRHTTSLVARHNIEKPLFVFINNKIKARQIMLRKTVKRSFVINEMFDNREEAIEKMKKEVESKGIFESGEKYLLVVDLFEKPADFPKVFEIVSAQ